MQTDGTYVFQHIPHSDIIFEGQIAPRVIIVDSIGSATRNVLTERRRHRGDIRSRRRPWCASGCSIEASAPVRTPSYMPKGTVQLVRFRNVSSGTDVDSDEFNSGPIEFWLLDTIPFGHHSNGQDGCLFTSQERDEGGECVEVAPTAEKVVNKQDGSFSTNYIEAMAVLRTHAPRFTGRCGWRLRDAMGLAYRRGHAVQSGGIRRRLDR